MNNKLRAFLEIIAYLAFLVVMCIGLQYLVDTFGLMPILNTMLGLMMAYVIYMVYKIRVSSLDYQDSVKDLEKVK